MASNTVTLVGNVTRDPELRFTPNGQPTATFGLAVNRSWVDPGTNERKDAVSFFDIITWRELAENCAETLGKGSRVFVTGRLEQRSWDNKEGVKQYKIEVVADEVGPSLRWASAVVTKNERREGANGGSASPVRTGGGGGGSAPQYNEEPF